MIAAIAVQFAMLSIIGSGLCLMLSSFLPALYKFTGKLFLIGIVLAGAAALIPANFE